MKYILFGNGIHIENTATFSHIQYFKNIEIMLNKYKKDGETDGKTLNYSEMYLKIFLQEMKTDKGWQIERYIKDAYMQHLINVTGMDMLIPRSYEVWTIFINIVVGALFIEKPRYKSIYKFKCKSYDKIYSLNYWMDIEQDINYLHGVYIDDKINYNLVLVPYGIEKNSWSMNVDSIRKKDISWRMSNLNAGNSKKYSTERIDEIKNAMPMKYPEVQDKGVTLEIFGVSPRGDKALFEWIKNSFENIIIYIYKYKHNKEEVDEYKELFKDVKKIEFFDSKDFKK